MVYDSFSDGVFIVTSNGICYTSAKGEVKKLDNFPYSNNYDMICDPDGTCWILGSAGIFVAQSKDLIENLKTEYPLINAKHGFRSLLIAMTLSARAPMDMVWLTVKCLLWQGGLTILAIAAINVITTSRFDYRGSKRKK